MKVKFQYENIPMEIEIPEEMLKEAIKTATKTGWVSPDRLVDKPESYYYIDRYGDVLQTMSLAKNCINNANLFTDYDLAKNIARYQTLERKIMRRIAEICGPIDWNDYSLPKYTFYYQPEAKEIRLTNSLICQYAGAWYFDTGEHARQIIEEFKDELIWYFTESRKATCHIPNEEIVKFHETKMEEEK